MYLNVKAPVSLYATKRNEGNRMASGDIKGFPYSAIAARNFVAGIL